MSEEFQNIPIRQVARDRMTFSALGAAAGFSLYVLSEIWPYPFWTAPALLALLTFVAVFCVVLLTMIGPVRPMRAGMGAAALAAATTILISIAGQRYVVATDVLESSATVGLAVLMVFMATPFLTLWLRNPARWRDYALLFEASWAMVMRFALGWAFVGVFWVLVFLSDALLEMVGITLFEYMFDVDWLAALLSGAVLGLGLAVVYELRERLSPFLVLRMLRLLLPLVLAVVALFIVALPFRGLSDLFGGVSSAGTLMAASMASLTLVSIAVDREDSLMVSTRGLTSATRILAMLQPVLAALAVWAVYLRVAQYGWTPDRVLAMVFAALLLFYGAGYCIAGLSGSAWTRRLRAVNTGLALVAILVAAAWMTPLLNANKIATQSQLSRFEDGRLKVDQVAFWSMQHDWGVAGQDGLEILAQMGDHPQAEAIRKAVSVAREGLDRYQFEQEITDQAAPDELARLVALMSVLPEGESVKVETFRRLPDYRRTQWLKGCERTQPNGQPGCAMVFGQFLPDPNRQAMFLFHDGNSKTRVHSVMFERNTVVAKEAYDPVRQEWPLLPYEALSLVQSGAFELKPRGGQALHVGDAVLEAVP